MKNGTAVYKTKEEAIQDAIDVLKPKDLKHYKTMVKKIKACGDGFEIVLSSGKSMTIDNR